MFLLGLLIGSIGLYVVLWVEELWMHKRYSK